MLTPEACSRAREQDALDEAIDAWCARLTEVRRLSDTTVRGYRHDLGSFSDWARREGVAPLSITHRELRRYLTELSRSGYAATTVSRRLSALRGLYRWMLREGRCPSAAVAAVSSPKLSRTLPHTMSDDEATRLLATCSGSEPVDLRDRAFLELLYASGARISEAAGLRLGDVDFEQRQVTLFGKGSKERIVPLYDRALESLRNGTAIAVVTSEGHPVAGARSTPLGAMRYVAVTSPALAASFRSAGLDTALRSAPVIFYDRKDTLQDRYLASFGIVPEAFTGVVHYAPSPTAMIDLAARGLGWCMAPESLVKPWIDKGAIAEIAPERSIDVPLFWQSSAIRSALLLRLGAVIRKTAAKGLRPLA